MAPCPVSVTPKAHSVLNAALMVASAGANLAWSDAAVTSVLQATMALALQAVKPASVVLTEHSAPSVKGLVDSAPAELVPLVFAVTTVNVASGDSLIAGRVPATVVRMSAIPTRALAWAAVITRGASTVNGALLVSMGTHGCHMGASAGLVPAPKGPGASDTSLLPATGMGIPSRLCATAEQVTQGSGVKLVPPGTLGTHQSQVAGANRVSAVETLTPRTRTPVIPALGNACVVCTTQRDPAVATASLASMGKLPDRAVTAVPATFWAQIPSAAHLPTCATVTQAPGSAHAFPMSKASIVTTVPPTFGTSPVAMAASLVLATQAGPEARPAMSSQGSATVMLALVGGLVLSARSSTGETLVCSAAPAIVILEE